MTVSSSASSTQFPGNGTTTVFPLPFRFFDNGDVTAYLIEDSSSTITPLSIGVNYTLIGAGEPEVDGNPISQLTMLVAPPNGQTLVVNREMEAVQETDIINQARFYPEIHENVFDRLTMLIQQAINRVSTSLSLDISRRYFDARGLQIKNLADPTDPQDATTKNYVDVQNDAQDVRIDALSAGLPGTNYAYPWYTTTTQSTKTLTPGFEFSSATLYLAGIAQTLGRSFSVSGNQILLAEAIPADTEVYAILGQNIAPTDLVKASDLANQDVPSLGAALWGYKGRNGYERLGDLVSVRDYIDSPVDGITSNQDGMVAAVADAISKNADLLWPAGVYVRTGSIPGFHQVRHVGPGVIKIGSAFFVVQPKGSATTRNTLYVAPSGSDIYDGLSSSTPFKTIQAAFDAVTNFGPQLAGLWDVSVQGVVSGPGVMAGVLSSGFITVKGQPSVGQPSSEIDVTGMNAAYGLSFSGGMRIQTRDLLVRGARNGTGLASGIVLDSGTSGYHVNTWTRDCEQNGINGNIKCRILVQGGDYEADATGIRVYASSSAFIGYNGVRVSVRNCDSGVDVSGSSYSHTDNIDFYDCTYGIVVDYSSHSTNYENSFTNVNVGWEARNGTINTLNPVVNTPFSVARSRSSFSMMGVDNGNNNYNYTMQFHPSLGNNGRLGFGYTTWNQPWADYQFSKGGTTAGYSLSGHSPCTAVFESNSNTILGLAAPDANFSAIWLGDSTSPRRSELRGQGGTLYVVQSNVTKFAFRTNDFIPFTDNNLNIGSQTFRPANTWSVNLRPGAGSVTWTSGAGTPEGSVTAVVGSMYTRTDGGAGTTLYVKEAGAGNTGWVAK
jgi:hypothetical protein